MDVAKTFLINRSNTTNVQSADYAKYVIPAEKYDYRVGLRSLQVHKSVISHDGRIWSATPMGLASYDGTQFRMYGHNIGLSSHGLRAIAVHADNTLWIGTDVGLEVLDISGYEPTVKWADALGTVNSLDVSERYVVIGTSRGLFYWDADKGVHRCMDAKLAHVGIKTALIAPNDEMWIAGETIGLARLSYEQQQATYIKHLRQLGAINVLARGPDNSILMGGERGIACVTEDGEIEHFLPMDKPVSALIGHNNLIWVCSGGAIIEAGVVDGGLTILRQIHDGVLAQHMMVDDFNNLWISTGNQALLKFSALRESFSSGIDTNIGQVFCIHQTPKGVLIGGARGLVLEDGTHTLEWTQVWDVVSDKFDKIWAATSLGLYCQVNPSFLVPYHHEDCDVVAAPCRALILYRGVLYVSSIRGLAKLGPNGPEEIQDDKGNSLGYTYTLHIGPKGELWVGTLGRGLWKLNDDGLTRVHADILHKNANVYAITHSESGEIFIAHDNLISRIDKNGKLVTLATSEDGVSAWALECFGENTLLAGTSFGLDFYDIKTGEIVRSISGNFGDLPWEFTTSRSIAIIDRHNIYCGIGAGLKTVNLEKMELIDRRPIARLASADWKNVDPEIKRDHAIVAAGKWYLEIGIRSNWYLDECLMRHRLVGFDDDWFDEEPLRLIRYSSLPQGKYTLEVELRSPHAGRGPVVNIFAFEVI